MSERELVEAMRLGSKNPTEEREPHDLGRFGLGLKSASFSQCRRLTVMSRKNGRMSCAIWDLDIVAERNNWNLDVLDNPTRLPCSDRLRENGTVVLWHKLDRLSGGLSQDQARRIEHINSELARAERHLRLVFHRFLEGRKPDLELLLNGRKLEAVDPFASANPATQKDPEEVINFEEGDVKIRCFTLPHHKMMSQQEWDDVGGPEGHLKSQGLYVYRERRLIIAGGWLGLARSKELTKLCRVRVDIPNSMDSEWKIDVKKASAQLPPMVKQRLKKVVERFVGTSKRTYRGKGAKLVDETRYPLWNRFQQDGRIVYRPNFDHPVLVDLINRLPEDLLADFKASIGLIGSGLPVETLHSDMLGNAESVVPDEGNAEQVRHMVEAMTVALLENGLPRENLSDVLQGQEFLKRNWETAEPILAAVLAERP
ncbi:MAG: ATP-binding protein [Falsiruegeria mediterranea]